MKAYAYLRVSGLSQVEGDGFTRQLETIKKFLADNSLSFAAEAREEGVSGTVEALDRPAFSDLVELIEKSRCGPLNPDAVDHSTLEPAVIVVERMDRLARDLMVQEFLLRECRQRHIAVYAADQGLVDLASDDIDPTRKLIRQVLGAVAEWEKSALVKKLYAARQRTGRWGGAKPYGTLNQNEARIKAAILTWHNNGNSYGEIAKMMNMTGEVNRRGGLWTRSAVRDVIKQRNQNARK